MSDPQSGSPTKTTKRTNKNRRAIGRTLNCSVCQSPVELFVTDAGRVSGYCRSARTGTGPKGGLRHTCGTPIILSAAESAAFLDNVQLQTEGRPHETPPRDPAPVPAPGKRRARLGLYEFDEDAD